MTLRFAGVISTAAVCGTASLCTAAMNRVKMEARLVMQMEVVANWLVNVTPRSERLSMCGVWIIGFPMQPRVSQR